MEVLKDFTIGQKQEDTSRTSRKKEKDKFTKITDKIIEKKGIKPKEFDLNAIKEARKKLYDEFVAENIESII